MALTKKRAGFVGGILVLGLALFVPSARVAASPPAAGGSMGTQEGASRSHEKHSRGEAPKKKAASCSSDASCGTGEHCSTRDGICLPPPGCKPGEMCAEVCYGTCVSDVRKAQEDKDRKGISRLCAVDGDCGLTATHCDACGCGSHLKGEAPAPCTGRSVACPTDPCAGQKAACRSGACVLTP